MHMVNIHEIKTHLSEYLSKVEQGETVIIARRNKPIAELRAFIEPTVPKKRRPMGLAKGKFRIADDAFAPMSKKELADWYDIRPEDPLHPDWKAEKI